MFYTYENYSTDFHLTGLSQSAGVVEYTDYTSAQG